MVVMGIIHITDEGQTFEFRAGDAAYFPPLTRGIWTIHETLRKTYCVRC